VRIRGDGIGEPHQICPGNTRGRSAGAFPEQRDVAKERDNSQMRSHGAQPPEDKPTFT
jgi:hypothetical protein